MNQRHCQIFAACTIGALAGSYCTATWWLGAIVGGVFGYVLYDLKQIFTATVNAWKQLKHAWMEQPSQLQRFQRQLRRRATLQLWWGLICMMITGAMLLGTALLAIAYSCEVSPEKLINFGWFFCALACPLILLAGLVAHFLTEHITQDCTVLQSVRGYQMDIRVAKRFQGYNPITATFYHAPRFIGFAIKLIGEIIYEVHSDARLVCGIHAALWTVISHVTGNGWIGALAAGVAGVWHCEVASILQRKTAH